MRRRILSRCTMWQSAWLTSVIFTHAKTIPSVSNMSCHCPLKPLWYFGWSQHCFPLNRLVITLFSPQLVGRNIGTGCVGRARAAANSTAGKLLFPKWKISWSDNTYSMFSLTNSCNTCCGKRLYIHIITQKLKMIYLTNSWWCGLMLAKEWIWHMGSSSCWRCRYLREPGVSGIQTPRISATICKRPHHHCQSKHIKVQPKMLPVRPSRPITHFWVKGAANDSSHKAYSDNPH